MVTLSAPQAQDHVALAEIELCGELMIAASAALEDRLSPDRIDEVLNVGQFPEEVPSAGQDRGGAVSGGAAAPVEARATAPEHTPRLPRQSHRRA
ncbi:hypothetical protein ABZ371_11615 [Streptomyces sp. NPDC005899]|uniref:hypothetical protein n=1 Tax=Streptomyces sp. NPDC005899 TaxID=3155716 RepID=UPI0034013A1E